MFRDKPYGVRDYRIVHISDIVVYNGFLCKMYDIAINILGGWGGHCVPRAYTLERPDMLIQ